MKKITCLPAIGIFLLLAAYTSGPKEELVFNSIKSQMFFYQPTANMPSQQNKFTRLPG